jgi:two-component system sensor histidine kinase KdpD
VAVKIASIFVCGRSVAIVAELSRRRLAVAWAMVVLGLPTLTAVLASARDHVDVASVLLLYLLLVVAVAVIGGAWPAAAAALGAAGCANWWFTPPYHRLTIDQTEDVVALVAFVVVAAVVSWLLNIATRHAADARSNELKTTLLAAVSHDLRTPLASIKASVTSLQQDDVAWTDDARDDLLAVIDEEADRLNGLVGNLLDMSRIATGAVQLSPRGVGLDEAVPAAMAALGARADDVDLDVPETLPRAWVDPGLFERAIANVLDNALSWSNGTKVRVQGVQRGAYVQVRVVDHGPGVDPPSRARMFEPFQRLDDRHRPGVQGVGPRSHGVGLGLAVARGFMTAMGGDIDAEETPGGGLTMVLSVPWALR